MDPKSILVRMPNWVGDLVMASGVLKRLRKAFPKAHITAMALDPVGQILNADPSIDELFLFRKVGWSSRHQDTTDVVAKIQQGQYSLGILLSNSFSSAWWFWRGHIPQRIGYKKDLRSWLLTQGIPRPPQPIHQVDEFHYLLDQAGIPGVHEVPALVIRKEEIQEALGLFKSMNIDPQHDRVVVIHPGAAYGLAKCWPLESFKALTQKLLEHENIKVIMVGDSALSQLAKDVFAPLSPHFFNFAGQTTLRELAALIQCSQLFIGNDSGPLHIAAAVGTRLIAIFGSTDPKKTAPQRETASVICKNAPCSPCFLRRCPIDFRCMRSITPDEVYEKALLILSQPKVNRNGMV